MTLSRGLDVSHHQGAVDWATLKRTHSLTWGACKATEGLGFTDSEFTRNWAALKAAGLVRIAYHFARPASDATTQAQRFLAVVKPVKGDVLCLDLEQSDGKTQAQVNAWAREFGTALRRLAPGITTVIYLGGYAANGAGRGLSAYFDYWWYPRYATMQPVTNWPTSHAPRLAGNTTGWDAPHIWQWAASLRGLPGLLVDANVSPLTAAQISAGPGHTVSPPPTQEDDLPTPADLINADVVPSPDDSASNPTWSLATYLPAIYRNARAAYEQASAARAIAEAQAAKGGALTADEIAAAAKAGAKAAIDEEISGATVNLEVQK